MDLTNGLSSAQVVELRQLHGWNGVPHKTPSSVLKFLKKFWGPSAWMIEIIAAISGFLRRIEDLSVASGLLLVKALAPLQVVTLASLIEKETGLDPERPLVSAVFHDRLLRSMLLQCDPTVIYAIKLTGEYDGKIWRSDLERKSPRNTYVCPRLAPGPICNTGEASIHAALYPQETNLLYCVSKKRRQP